jgi:teichuronic acid biosynthesis glycosyltransferase TuaC
MFSVQRIRALQNAGCEVVVVCPILITLPARFLLKPIKLFKWITDQLRLPPEDNYQGIHVYYPKWVWFPKGLFGWYTSYFLYRQVCKRVKKLVIEFQPEVILSSWLPDGLAACKLGGLLGIPTISIADGSDVNQLSHSYLGWGYACRCLNSESSTVIFVSIALKEKANSLGLNGGTNAVLYNGADIHLFQTTSTKPDDTVFTILSVGRLVPVKGYQILLTAFARLYKQLNQLATLILVGEGPLRGALAQQATDLGIFDAVEFVGAVKHEKTVSYYQRAHVFCLPSFSEGSPTVIIEAMACGIPIVASDVGGVGEIVSPETGILVPPGNPELLCEALLQAKGRIWNGDAIRQEVENHYEWGRWTEEMLRLIRTSHG